jgi:hypothetical protein
MWPVEVLEPSAQPAVRAANTTSRRMGNERTQSLLTRLPLEPELPMSTDE